MKRFLPVVVVSKLFSLIMPINRIKSGRYVSAAPTGTGSVLKVGWQYQRYPRAVLGE